MRGSLLPAVLVLVAFSLSDGVLIKTGGGGPKGTCPESIGVSSVYLEDTKDCRFFYQCDEAGYAKKLQCPSDTTWNPKISACDWEDKSCIPSDNEGESSDATEAPEATDTTEATELTDATETTGAPEETDAPEETEATEEPTEPAPESTPKPEDGGPVGECPEKVEGVDVYLPDSLNSGVFYECNELGLPSRFQCPSGLIWNAEKNWCDWGDLTCIPPGNDEKKSSETNESSESSKSDESSESSESTESGEVTESSGTVDRKIPIERLWKLKYLIAQFRKRGAAQ